MKHARRRGTGKELEMAINIYAVVKSPEYSAASFPATGMEGVKGFLSEAGVSEVDGFANPRRWSLSIDGFLREAVRRLLDDPSALDGFLPRPHRGRGKGRELAAMLREGIDGMDKEGVNWLDLEIL